MLTGIDHVAIKVKNLEKSLDFYLNKLGLKDHTPNNPMHFLGDDKNVFFVLTETSEQLSHSKKSVDHLAFSVDKIEKTKNDLMENGVAIDHERTDDDEKGKSYYFKDPDGNQLEIYGEL